MTRNQWVAQRVRQHGFEITPDEVPGLVADAYAKLREYMLAKGLTPPDSDDELRQLIRRAMGQKRP